LIGEQHKPQRIFPAWHLIVWFLSSFTLRTLIFLIPAGVAGVLARYYAGIAISGLWQGNYPLGTFLINILGSFLIGIVYGIGVERPLIPTELRIGIMVGFLGGFTTFSSYSLETVRLIESGNAPTAITYFALSNGVGLIATLCGILIVRQLV